MKPSPIPNRFKRDDGIAHSADQLPPAEYRSRRGARMRNERVLFLSFHPGDIADV
jgi:hypothetical protein